MARILAEIDGPCCPRRAVVHTVWEARDGAERFNGDFSRKVLDEPLLLTWETTGGAKPSCKLELPNTLVTPVEGKRIAAVCVTFLHQLDNGWNEQGRVRFLNAKGQTNEAAIKIRDADATSCGRATLELDAESNLKWNCEAAYVPLRRIVGDLSGQEMDVYRRLCNEDKWPKDVRLVDDPWFFARDAEQRDRLEKYVQANMNWFLARSTSENADAPNDQIPRVVMPANDVVNKAHMAMYDNNVFGMPGWAFVMNELVDSSNALGNLKDFKQIFRCAERFGNKTTEDILACGLQLCAASLRYASDTRIIGTDVARVEAFSHVARLDGIGDCEDFAYQIVAAATGFKALKIPPGEEYKNLQTLQSCANEYYFGLVIGTVNFSADTCQSHAFNLAIPINPGSKRAPIVMDGTNPLNRMCSKNLNFSNKEWANDRRLIYFKPPSYYEHLVSFFSPETPHPEYYFCNGQTYGVRLPDVLAGQYQVSVLLPGFSTTHTFFAQLMPTHDHFNAVDRSRFDGVRNEVKNLLMVNRQGAAKDKADAVALAGPSAGPNEHTFACFTHAGHCTNLTPFHDAYGLVCAAADGCCFCRTVYYLSPELR